MAHPEWKQVGGLMSRNQWLITGGSVALSVGAGLLTAIHANAVLTFVVSGGALALRAALVGLGTEQLGSHLGPGATGVLQSSLGNLPELFVGYFALRSGLIAVIQAALVGSILGNSLLVLGLAFFVGGLRHGTQRFASEVPRMIATLTMLSVSALILPTLVYFLHTPAASHEDAFSIGSAVILLIVSIASIPTSLQGGPTALPEETEEAIGSGLSGWRWRSWWWPEWERRSSRIGLWPH
jgi:Ca2+:H+ antiporter